MPELKDAVAAAVARWREYRDAADQEPTIVKALIEAVTVPCPCYPGFNYCHDSSCCCDGTGRVPRDWEEIGEGALWGALVGVADAYPVLTEVLEELQSNNDHAGLDEWADWARNSHRPGFAALAAVDKAVMRAYGGSHD